MIPTNRFLTAFADELLVKRAGILSAVAKHPWVALTAGTTALGAGSAALSGFKRGMGGEKPRYLQASKYGPSEAFYQNFHDALPHDQSLGETRRMSRYFDRAKFNGGT